MPMSLTAQNAIDAYNLSQPDLKGTARFMGMAGAFGALGGDLSSLSQNPAGIGVYRSSDIGFTLDLDVQNSSTEVRNFKENKGQTKFYLNNIGAVLTMRLPSKTIPNLNAGFTYNKGASFNRVYQGNFNSLQNSMSNYIAAQALANGLTEGDVSFENGDPYNAPADYYQAPWLTVLGYNSYLINPQLVEYTDKNGKTNYMTDWSGLWSNNSMTGNNTTGMAQYFMKESGGIDEFNIALGGNINNVLYWGMNFDIVSLSYSVSSYWGENLENAIVPDENLNLRRGPASWGLNSRYKLSGTGFNYQLGFILKPIQPLRIGFAFHTPTWYNLDEEYGAAVNYNIGSKSGYKVTNEGYLGGNSYNFRTPWKIIASAAGVLGNNLIVSFDYEWANYGKMKFMEQTYYNINYDWDYPDPWAYGNRMDYDFMNNNDPYNFVNKTISWYYKSTNTFRVGVEFKPVSSLSIRAGYSYVSSSVRQEAKNNQLEIYTSSLTPSYRLDNSTNYITCGLGYRYSHIYIDLAYVYKRMGSEYHGYSPIVDWYDEIENLDKSIVMKSPQSKLNFTNNQIVLSMGYRF